MDKQKILTNVSNFTAEQLFEEIKQGNVTLDELRATGDLDSTKRNRVRDIQLQFESNDVSAWTKVEFGTETDLRRYIQEFPVGKYIEDAKKAIRRLQQEWEAESKVKEEIINNLKINSNLYTPYQINNFLKKGTITEDDLIGSNIPYDVIRTLKSSANPTYLELGETPNTIPEGYTEVYFWGIPGSGKTCALAALLSTAEKKGLLEIAIGPGFDYMTRLKNIFVEEYATLPPPTNVEETQYLPFTLKKETEKYSRSVSLIELSGEIFQCFLKKNAGKQLFEQHERTFNTLMSFLKGKNRKIHFFFIDFNKENKKDKDGYLQSDYLNSAATFFSNNDIFEKSTDAVYLVLTKSDLMPCNKDERIDYSIKHLHKNNFTAFINVLKHRCKQHSINAGELTVEPFSLGNVYFQQICDFDNSSAIEILDILIDRIRPSKKSILDILNN